MAAEETYTTPEPDHEANAVEQRVADQGRFDPAPNPVDAARETAANFVQAISKKAKLSLGERRDELDTLMERITTSEKALVRYIGEFARFNHEAITIASEIKASIEQAAQPFAADPPATLTQSNGKAQS